MSSYFLAPQDNKNIIKMCSYWTNKLRAYVKKVPQIYCGYKKSFFIDPKTKRFIEFCVSRWPKFPAELRKSEVLVEFYPLDQTVLAFSYFANLFAEKHNSKIISFSISTRDTTLYRWRYRRFIKIYQSFNAYAHFNTRISGFNAVDEASVIFSDVIHCIRTKDDVLDISINGDRIGNEVYEAYLREKCKPTIDIHSVEFKEYLLECIKIYLFWKDYFKNHRVTGVVLSHGIYKYGIVKTIACNNGVPVYLPTVRSLFCLKKSDEWGIPKYELYPEQFKRLPVDIRDKGIVWAKKRLALRLSGEVGVDMSYSTQSAFKRDPSSKNVLRKSNRIKVLIATHDFFDNPNAYGRNLFADFYEWISFLGEMSEITEYDWYLKTHPDVLPGNDEVLEGLLTRYKNITRLPSETSHLQLAEEGVTFVLTVYGSVGHECPLLGQTVINAGQRNPHIGYDFNIHVKSIEEYRDCLLNLAKIDHKVEKAKIYEFYFMHYKLSGYNKLFFDSFERYLSEVSVEDQITSIAYEYYLNARTAESDAILCNKIQGFIASGDYKYYDEIEAVSCSLTS